MKACDDFNLICFSLRLEKQRGRFYFNIWGGTHIKKRGPEVPAQEMLNIKEDLLGLLAFSKSHTVLYITLCL